MPKIHLSGLAADLQARSLTEKPIRIGLIGSGMMGTDIVTQVLQMQGILVAAIADINVTAAMAASSICVTSRASM